MPRLPRIILPGVAYHVGQRGNRRMSTFFEPSDYTLYLTQLIGYAVAFGLDVLGYCLMPNHVHIACRPRLVTSLSLALGQTARSYSTIVNKRQGWTGSLWDGRFWSSPCEEEAMFRVLAYIEMNPVRAGLVKQPCDWPWSSASAHMLGHHDPALSEAWPVPPSEWGGCLDSLTAAECERIGAKLRSGRPFGSDQFVEGLEQSTGRVLVPRKPGPRAGWSNLVRPDAGGSELDCA